MKFCDYCGEVLERKVYDSGLRETPTVFARRSFCNVECKNKGGGQALNKRVAFKPQQFNARQQAFCDQLMAKVTSKVAFMSKLEECGNG